MRVGIAIRSMVRGGGLADAKATRFVQIFRNICAMRVSSAEFPKSHGRLAVTALTEPDAITRNGRDGRVGKQEDFTDETMELIARSKMPPGLACLDQDLEVWQP